MSADALLGGLVAVFVAGYLAYVLFKPERF